MVLGATYAMAREKLGPDLVMFSALAVLIVAGVVQPADAVAGFANMAVVTIGVLFVCAQAVQDTGALRILSDVVFGRSRDPRSGLVRLMVPTAILSAFMNNTPIVAMFIPMVRDYARRVDRSASAFLIPLSYSAILGGTCTLIGTSANLVVAGMHSQRGMGELGMLDIAWVGVPMTVISLAFLTLAAPRLLPDRRGLFATAHDEAREYLAEVMVASDSPLVNRTVEAAGLRHLPGLFLVEIRRADGFVIQPVAPQDRLKANDHLVFTGIASTVSDLTQLPGLNPVDEQPAMDEDRGLFEVVVSHRSPLIGRTVRDAEFRRRYDAAILAVHRSGERIGEKIGDIVLQAGDTLMLSASPGFRRAWQDSTAFYLVSAVAGDPPARYQKANLTLLALLTMVALPAVAGVSLMVSAMGVFVFLLATGCITPRSARQAVNWPVLVLIGSAIGVAGALEKSGAASAVGALLIQVTLPLGPLAVLTGVFILGAMFASFVSNAAAAALVFPVAMTAAASAGIDTRVMALTLAIASSAGFATPIGSPANLLVYGPGGYRYGDYARLGLPLVFIAWVCVLVFLPLAWPL